MDNHSPYSFGNADQQCRCIVADPRFRVFPIGMIQGHAGASDLSSDGLLILCCNGWSESEPKRQVTEELVSHASLQQMMSHG